MLSSAILLAASMVMGQGGEDSKPGPDYEQLKAMEWMIGDWEADYVVTSPGLGLDGFTPVQGFTRLIRIPGWKTRTTSGSSSATRSTAKSLIRGLK